MADKSFEDMTASELLRWAALNENDCYANNTAHARLFSAVEGRDYYRTTDDEDRDALRAIADKIDAEASTGNWSKARVVGFIDRAISSAGLKCSKGGGK